MCLLYHEIWFMYLIDPKEKRITTWPTAIAEKSVGTNAHAVLARLTWDSTWISSIYNMGNR
jgi:hypothetical protein